jgi:RNA polymerase sigma factor (TIGR02999 family)
VRHFPRPGLVSIFPAFALAARAVAIDVVHGILSVVIARGGDAADHLFGHMLLRMKGETVQPGDPRLNSADKEPSPSKPEITALLADWRAGRTGADDRLANAVAPELRNIAARFLRAERSNHTLEPNALVNELWLRLMTGKPVTFHDRLHFYAIAANTMRRILVDHARARIAEKRGGPQQQLSLTAVEGWSPVRLNEDLLQIDQALSKLEKKDARAATVVELRVFGGLLEQEIAETLGVSLVTVREIPTRREASGSDRRTLINLHQRPSVSVSVVIRANAATAWCGSPPRRLRNAHAPQ